MNENNIAVLINGEVHLFETNMEKLVLGYYHRRKRVQEKYAKLYGFASRARKKVLRKLKEKKKDDVKWKTANLVVREAVKRGCSVVLERLVKRSAESMITRIRDRRLRHRIYRASFRGVQRAVEEKAKEHGVPVIYVNPKNTSRMYPLHGVEIKYSNSRIGVCSTVEECGIET